MEYKVIWGDGWMSIAPSFSKHQILMFRSLSTSHKLSSQEDFPDAQDSLLVLFINSRQSKCLFNLKMKDFHLVHQQSIKKTFATHKFNVLPRLYTVSQVPIACPILRGGKKEKASVTIDPIICFLLSFCSGLGVLRLNSLAKILSEGLSQWGFVNLRLFLTLSVSSSIYLTEKKNLLLSPLIFTSLLPDHGSHSFYQATWSV